MRVELLRIFGTFIAALTLLLFLMGTQKDFIPFEYSRVPIDDLISVNEEIGERISDTLWNQRQLDMIILAFLLFVSATCCATVLRIEKADQK